MSKGVLPCQLTGRKAIELGIVGLYQNCFQNSPVKGRDFFYSYKQKHIQEKYSEYLEDLRKILFDEMSISCFDKEELELLTTWGCLNRLANILGLYSTGRTYKKQEDPNLRFASNCEQSA